MPFTVPTLAIGAQPVGDALARQLTPVADHFEQHLLAKSGHIVPLDASRALRDRVVAFLRATT